jgi:cation diffusion facilitator family transporter
MLRFMDRAQKVALASVGVGLVVLALKLVAWRLTGSIALYSDALESIINVAAAVAALIALHIAVKPADDEHPFGHYKAEYFSAVLEGIMIAGAAIAILWQAYLGLIQPQPIEAPAAGIAINIAAGVINGGWAWLLLRWSKRWRSPALEASARHLFTDVWTSVGVVVGVALTSVTGWLALDPLVAALVALNILWSGWHMVRQSVNGLMDAAVPPDVMCRIKELISCHAEGAVEAHDLRTRQVGRAIFIEFHLVVPGAMSVTDSHAICDRLEQALRAEIADARVVIHVEPEAKAKHHGIVVL